MKDFIKAIFAGIMIGIAGVINIAVGGSYVGAILFSIGLCVICLKGYNLYTGKIGYIESFKDLPKYLLFALGNLIGVALVSLITTVDTSLIVESKLSAPLLITFGRAIGCGFLMYIAVDIYKKEKSLFGVAGCVVAFLLAGFEHSIADMFYLVNNLSFSLQSLIFILVVLAGNTIGSLVHKLVD